MEMAKAGRGDDQYMVRFPPGLRDRIKEAAWKKGRSMNSEIIATLEREYPAPSDVMHVHLENIRKALDQYERETDPRKRLELQNMVEAMVTMGHAFQVEWGSDEG